MTNLTEAIRAERAAKRNPILRYYRNKARSNAEHALKMLAEAEALGYWPSGYSRKVKAALNKTHREETAAAGRGAALAGGSSIDVDYGCFERAPRNLDKARKLAAIREPADSRDAHAYLDWCEEFSKIAERIARLDATRPKPVYLFKTVSPTVFANISTSLGLEFSSVRAPKIVWVKTEGKNAKGNVIWEWIPEIVWPEGTIHNKSKFAWGSRAGNSQCEACGHAIKNWNWVPLVLDGAGKPHALWVGKDCASTLFGCKVTGEAEFKRPATKEAT